MADTTYGIREYTCSDKTKRPQKNQLDLEKLEKRNSRQRHLYVTLENIDELFSNDFGEKWPVCYDMIFNIIQGKVTKYFNTRSYDRKKELSYDCINRLYSVLKRKLLKMHNDAESDVKMGLFFYLSQFFRYVELVVYSTVFYGTQDYKHIVQEPENFSTDDVLKNDLTMYEDEYISPTQELLYNTFNNEEIENTDGLMYDKLIDDNSIKIKMCIENNNNLENKEKQALFHLYKSCYSKFGESALTKRDKELINTLRFRLDYEPDLLNDLQEILENGKGKSTEN